MNPCESCHGGCCRSFAIALTGADVLRIERTLDLNFTDFACHWADPDGVIAQNYAPHLYFEDEPQTPFVLALMHQKSAFFPETTKCQFLLEGQPDADHPHGQARCGIYNSRPAACRVFPVRFNETCELAVINDVPSKSRDSEHGVYELCPRPWEPQDLDPVQTIEHLIVARHEMHFFLRIAEIWNQQLRPWELFPTFLHAIYDQRVIRDSATSRPESDGNVAAEDTPALAPPPQQESRRAA